MIDRSTVFGIIGLGLLGGSYAKGLSENEYQVIGIDLSANAAEYALKQGWCVKAGTDPSLLGECDIVISALYPNSFIEWLKKYQDVLKSGALLSDVTGIKRYVIKEISAFLRKDVEFIATHPMAGREFKGIEYADSGRFKGANYIVVPTQENTSEAIETAEEIGRILGFSNIVKLSADRHDEMIGYLSQLTHVIAVSLMNANDRTDLAQYSGDSFRDLTRIAFINEDLWPELFVRNKDYLLEEIDAFVNEMICFRNLIETEDYEGMKQRLKQSGVRRKAFTEAEKQR